MLQVKEGTGITDLDFAWGSDFIETARYSGNKMSRVYVARIPSDRALLVNPVLRRPEHSEYRWMQLDDVLGLVMLRLQIVLRWSAARMGR